MPTKSKKPCLHLQKTTRFERLEWHLEPENAAILCHRCPNTVRRWINGAPIDRVLSLNNVASI
ncbi:hypothetical protein [Endozoicomonas ascidiicola]|uniref:hypothetical protein n=1 Tax=Endozoicomonas ascidiicola TaxID=1698521 RepID=UPI000ADC2D25|nr:hypothetical protein [Endozoicomonas ascidiicola]